MIGRVVDRVSNEVFIVRVGGLIVAPVDGAGDEGKMLQPSAGRNTSLRVAVVVVVVVVVVVLSCSCDSSRSCCSSDSSSCSFALICTFRVAMYAT